MMSERRNHDPIPPCWPLAIAAAVAAGALRLLPLGLPNFAPVGALALYAGARLPMGVGLVLPLAVMAVTDRILWLQTGDEPFTLSVYIAYFHIATFGWLLRRTKSFWKIGLTAAAGDAVFFLVTNFQSWVVDHGREYARSLAGLMDCYVKGIPFHRNTTVSTLVFVPVFFGLHALATRRAEAEAPAAVKGE